MACHKPIPDLTESDLERFWSKVNKGASDDCWLWTSYKDKDGYGIICIQSIRYRAHRVSYTLIKGEPGDLNINHTCDNPLCVNPLHLWKGTQQEGIVDKVSKCRQSCLKGERHGRSKLTEKQVNEILLSDEILRIIADRYGVNLTTISDIKRRKTWKHIRGTS